MEKHKIFINYEDFIKQVLSCECAGIKQSLQYLFTNKKFMEKYLNKLFLPYPFQKSYLEHLIETNSFESFDSVDEYSREHIEDIIYSEVDLGVTLQHHTFGSYWDSRLEQFFDSCISASEYDKIKDKPIVINQERNNFFVVDKESTFTVAPNSTIFRAFNQVFMQLYLYQPNEEYIRLGDVTDDISSSEMTEFINTLNKKLEDGDTVIYPFEWIEY